MTNHASYLFPFHTCEKPNSSGIAQPYSAFLNLVSCVIILYFLSKTKTTYARLLLVSILFFEIFHTFSHSIHIPNNSQIIITHILAYFVNFCYLFALYQYSGVFPDNYFLLYLSLVIAFDIYAFHSLPFVFYLSSQFLIFMSLFSYYYGYFSNEIKERIPLLYGLTLLVLLLFINESYNCKQMLDFCHWFPFHIFIEIAAIFIVYNISSIFSEL